MTSAKWLQHINPLRPSDAYIWVVKLTIIGSDDGLLPGRRQAIVWTNAGILLIGPLGTNFCEILIGIQTFSFKKMHLKMSSAKWCPFRLGLNVLMAHQVIRLGNHLFAQSSPSYYYPHQLWRLCNHWHWFACLSDHPSICQCLRPSVPLCLLTELTDFFRTFSG